MELGQVSILGFNIRQLYQAIQRSSRRPCTMQAPSQSPAHHQDVQDRQK